jgi:hypothetical protein
MGFFDWFRDEKMSILKVENEQIDELHCSNPEANLQRLEIRELLKLLGLKLENEQIDVLLSSNPEVDIERSEIRDCLSYLV